MNLHPLLSDWFKEMARVNGTSEEWQLNFAMANYIRTVDPDWCESEIQALFAEMERER